MPCTSSNPTPREIESQLVATLLIYVYEWLDKTNLISEQLKAASESCYGNTIFLDTWTAELCALVRSLNEEQLHTIVYDGTSRISRRLADWWEDHQEVDSAREAREIEAEDEKLVDIFIDLSLEEKRKLLEKYL